MNKSYQQLPAALEGQEQQALFEWAELLSGQHPELNLMYHIPNGGKRSKTEAKRFKAMGVKPGVPDIFLPAARGSYHGLYIELKRRQGGREETVQKEWIKALTLQGYYAIVCHGWVDASKVVLWYLGL